MKSKNIGDYTNIVGSTEQISPLFLLKCLWSECERVGKL